MLRLGKLSTDRRITIFEMYCTFHSASGTHRKERRKERNTLTDLLTSLLSHDFDPNIYDPFPIYPSILYAHLTYLHLHTTRCAIVTELSDSS